MAGLPASGANTAESRLRVGVDFLRDPRVRAAPFDERIVFLQQRAGLTRDEALEASRIADVADGASARAPDANYRWWGRLAVTAAAIGGGMALLWRDPAPHGFLTDPAPPPLQLGMNGAAKADAADGLPSREPEPAPEPALLNGVRQLLAESEARHERATQLLREQLAVLVDGHIATTAALERLSARLDEAIASATAHSPARASSSCASKAAETTASSNTRAYSTDAESAALRHARAELAGAGAPMSPFTPAGACAWETHTAAAQLRVGLAHELETPALPSPAPSVPPPTPASAVPPSGARLTYAEMVACVQNGRQPPGFVHVDESPLAPAEQTPGAQPTRAARPKPWERGAMVIAASAGHEPRRLGLGSASLTAFASEEASEPSETPLPLTGHAAEPARTDEAEEWRGAHSPFVPAFPAAGVDQALKRFEPFGLDATPATSGRANESESEGPSTS